MLDAAVVNNSGATVPLNVAAFLMGACTVGYLVAALLFLKFWRRTHDGLFLAFAAAFTLMALNQGLPGLLDIPLEERGDFYLLRLAAFLLIIFAILRKNISSRR